MSVRTLLAGGLALTFATPVLAQEYVPCLTVNRVATEMGLRQYQDHQIENGLCMFSKEVARFVVAGDSIGERVCMEATGHIMREFLRRFPGRDPAIAAGRC